MLASLAIAAIMFFMVLSLTRTWAAVKEVPEAGYDNAAGITRSKVVKAGKYYISWTEKDQYDGSRIMYTTKIYRQSSKNGAKKLIGTVKKRVKFVATDGTFVYYDTGEQTFWNFTRRQYEDEFQTKIKVWKMKISTGEKKAIAAIATKDMKAKWSYYPGETRNVKLYALDVSFARLYGKYAYFIPKVELPMENGELGGHLPWSWQSKSLVQVDLTNGKKKSIPIKLTLYTIWTERYIVDMPDSDGVTGRKLVYIDLKNGGKTDISGICLPLQRWCGGDASSSDDPVTVNGDLVYYIEKTTMKGNIRVACFNMKTHVKQDYVTGNLKKVKAGGRARPFEGFVEYLYNGQWYRYFYGIKKEVKIPGGSIGVADHKTYADVVSNVDGTFYKYRVYYKTGKQELIDW